MAAVLLSDPITESGLQVLRKAGLEVVYLPDAHRQDLLQAAPKVRGWIVRSGTRLDQELLQAAEGLQVIGRAGVGVDNIDLAFATRRGIVVMNTPDVNTVSAAEHTVALILALARNIPRGHQQVAEHHWDRQALVGSELRQKTLGIVGLGKIGREVLQELSAFPEITALKQLHCPRLTSER